MRMWGVLRIKNKNSVLVMLRPLKTWLISRRLCWNLTSIFVAISRPVYPCIERSSLYIPAARSVGIEVVGDKVFVLYVVTSADERFSSLITRL